MRLFIRNHWPLYCQKTGRIMEWPCPSVYPSVCPQLLLNTISRKPLIWLTAYFDIALILLRHRKLLIWGILWKFKMATIAVWRLTLYPIQDIACERCSLKTTCPIDFTFWHGICYWFGAFHENQVWRLTWYPIQDIACEPVAWKPLVGLTSHFDIALIPLRPQMLLIWGILRKSRWPPQQFEDKHCTLCRIFFVKAVAWKRLSD